MEFLKKTSKGYIYDKRIFWAGMFLIVLFAIGIMSLYNFDFSNSIYYKCISPNGCLNPYFANKINCDREWLYGKDCLIKCDQEWCTQEILTTGEYGTKPPNNIILGFNVFILSIILLSFCLNHLAHNKGKKFHYDFLLSEKQKRIIKKVTENFNED